MIAQLRRVLTLSTIAFLITALASFGGYRLGSSSSSLASRPGLAAGNALTYVSGIGNDMNSGAGCPRATPCLNVSTAASVTAAGGQVTAIDAGKVGSTTITQALTIDGGPGRALIQGSAPVILVSAGPNDVVILRHLEVIGSSLGSGIYFNTGKALILDDVIIAGNGQNGIYVSTSSSASLTVINSRIENNAASGISIAPTAGTVQVAITNSQIHDNGQTGVAIAPSGGTARVSITHTQIAGNYFGIIAQDGSDVSLTDSVVSGSTSIGVGCQTFGGGPCTIQTAHDRIDHNWAAVWMYQPAGSTQITETLSDNDIFSNTYGIYGDFGGSLTAASAGNNRFVNNIVKGTVTSTVTQM